MLAGRSSKVCGSMDRGRFTPCSLLLIFCVLSANFKVIFGNTSVLFLHNPTRQYVRQPSAKVDSLSPAEFGAITSVLLGFAPPSSLSAASSYKLNEVLMPNPFDRPRAMLILEVAGVKDFPLNAGDMRINVEDDQKVDVQLPGEDEVYIVKLNELERADEISDKEISNFASWLGGSYTEDTARPLNGELIIPAANGGFLRLHMAEGSDKKFVMDLLVLINGIRDVSSTNQMLTERAHSPAELINGRFDGIQVLQDRYGKGEIARSGLDVFSTAISKAFSSLASSRDGKIVGVIGYGYQPEGMMENMFHISIPSKSSARALEETSLPPIPPQIAQVFFVRTTLAWITGIILLISTLLGIHFLLNMPLTKDTLLYSNVKLD